MDRILILGLGNILMGDEGIGVRAVEHLMHYPWPENVDIIDGGTGGFHLLSLIQSYDRIIIIDAALNDSPPGTIQVLTPKRASDFPRSLSSHDIGLKDLIESVTLTGTLPPVELIAVTVKDWRHVTMELSPEVRDTLTKIYRHVIQLINNQ